MTLITGNTYPHRQQLRAMGGEWDASVKGWRVPEDKAEDARGLVDGPQPTRINGWRETPKSGPRRTIIYTTFSSGVTVKRNARGTCEDAPCCGCCS